MLLALAQALLPQGPLSPGRARERIAVPWPPVGLSHFVSQLYRKTDPDESRRSEGSWPNRETASFGCLSRFFPLLLSAEASFSSRLVRDSPTVICPRVAHYGGFFVRRPMGELIELHFPGTFSRRSECGNGWSVNGVFCQMACEYSTAAP